MECGNLSLICVRSQTVRSVVLCDFVQCIFYSLFYLCAGYILGCDTKIVCIDITPRSRVDMLVVCIYGQAVLLFPPSATFVVQLNMESAT